MGNWINWLESLKVGDEVVVRFQTYSTVRTVERITPKGWIIVNGITYVIGRERTSNVYGFRSSLIEPTEQLKQEIHIKETVNNACNHISGFTYLKNNPLSYEDAVEIIKILSKYRR